MLAPCDTHLNIYITSYKERAKLSPDKKAVAVMIDVTGASGGYPYTVIYDTTTLKPMKYYKHYKFPEWHPDGRLLLSGEDKGLYITNRSFSSLTKIGDQLNSYIKNPDISPSGKKIVFEMNKDIWIMDIDGSNLNPLIEDQEILYFPTWSPNGKYVAYLSAASTVETLKKITFFNLKTKVKHILDAKNFFLPNEYGSVTDLLYGPLSWVK